MEVLRGNIRKRVLKEHVAFADAMRRLNPGLRRGKGWAGGWRVFRRVSMRINSA
jgi:hypothetical protein